MPATRKVSEGQLETLVAWIEQHPVLASGAQQYHGTERKQNILGLWQDITSQLNDAGDGIKKPIKGWRDYWSDLKCKVKRKWISISKANANGTSGDPSLGSNLTPIEERISNLMGLKNQIWDATSIEVPVDICLPSQSPPPKKALPIKKAFLTPKKNGMSPKCAVFLPKYVLDTDKRRFPDDKRQREIAEARLAVERSRLAVEERRLAVEERRLAVAEQRLAQGQSMLLALQRIADAVCLPPLPPPRHFD